MIASGESPVRVGFESVRSSSSAPVARSSPRRSDHGFGSSRNGTRDEKRIERVYSAVMNAPETRHRFPRGACPRRGHDAVRRVALLALLMWLPFSSARGAALFRPLVADPRE